MINRLYTHAGACVFVVLATRRSEVERSAGRFEEGLCDLSRTRGITSLSDIVQLAKDVVSDFLGACGETDLAEAQKMEVYINTTTRAPLFFSGINYYNIVKLILYFFNSQFSGTSF